MADRKYILVLLPQNLGFGREIVRGIRQYAITCEHWIMRVGEPVSPEVYFGLTPMDGVIGFFADTGLVDAVCERGIPAVNVSSRSQDTRLPRILPDNVQVGRDSAQHLIERGFRNFAFVHVGDHFYSQQRAEGALSILREHGLADSIRFMRLSELPAYLAEAEVPLGILGANDVMASESAIACLEKGLHVPEQVSIVGADNDVFLCESSVVEITSVDTAGREVGRRAAELLDSLMAGEPAPEQPILVPPGPLVVRPSSDTFASMDEDVAFAARYIREHACKQLKVDQIMEHLSISRRTLEKRFHEAFGRSLHEEIRRQQIQRARQLLTETDLPIGEIAFLAGFCDRKHFNLVFRTATGTTPTDCRQTAGTHGQ
jgi:LacI family transcriptional regulator